MNDTTVDSLNPRLVMKSALASFGTVFSNILANPEDLATSNDIDLMNFVVEIVHSFKQHGSYIKVATQLLGVCEVMTRVAREVVRARRRRRPMLDYPSTSLSTTTEALAGSSSGQFDWNTMISGPPTTSLEQFLSIAPFIGDKNSLDTNSEIVNFPQYDTAAIQVSESLPLSFGDTYATHQTSNGNSSWPFNADSQGSDLGNYVNNLENVDLRFPL